MSAIFNTKFYDDGYNLRYNVSIDEFTVDNFYYTYYYVLPYDDKELIFDIECYDFTYRYTNGVPVTCIADFTISFYIEYAGLNELVYKEHVTGEISYDNKNYGFNTSVILHRQYLNDILLTNIGESDETGLKPFKIHVEIKSDLIDKRLSLGYPNETKLRSYFIPNYINALNRAPLINGLFKVDIDYIELPTDISYRQTSLQPHIDEIKSITISILDTNLFTLLNHFYNFSFTLAYVFGNDNYINYISKLMSDGSITFTKEDITNAIIAAEEDRIYNISGITIYVTEEVSDNIANSVSTLPMKTESVTLYQTTRNYTIGGEIDSEGNSPVIRMNKDVGSIIINGEERWSLNNNKKFTQSIRATDTLLIEYGNVYCKNFVFEPANKECDLDKIFCAYNNGTASYTFKGGVPSSYADRLPHSSLASRSFALTVKSPGLHILDNGDIQVVATQLIEMDHDVTNSSGISKVAYSRFSRGMVYLNGEITKTAWYHEETYDSDGNLYYFNELTGKFTQR